MDWRGHPGHQQQQYIHGVSPASRIAERVAQQSRSVGSSLDIEGSIPSENFISLDGIDDDAIASGGFASIHIGRLLSGSKVAVKVVRVSQQNERVAKRRLSREIVVWRRLKHQNVTPLIGVASCPKLSRLEVMITPWYNNGSAAAYLASGPHPPEERLMLSLGVASGLKYLHELDPVVVHGDLKPSNVLIDDEACPKICDFGLARIINEEARSGLTTTTLHNTTPLYAAPEILLAEDDAAPFEPSTISDIYSLGSLLYEFLTGNIPYSNLSNNMQILVAVVKGTKPATRPSSLTEIEKEQWKLFESCWDQPKNRPCTAEVVNWLQGLVSGGFYGYTCSWPDCMASYVTGAGLLAHTIVHGNRSAFPIQFEARPDGHPRLYPTQRSQATHMPSASPSQPPQAPNHTDSSTWRSVNSTQTVPPVPHGSLRRTRKPSNDDLWRQAGGKRLKADTGGYVQTSPEAYHLVLHGGVATLTDPRRVQPPFWHEGTANSGTAANSDKRGSGSLGSGTERGRDSPGNRRTVGREEDEEGFPSPPRPLTTPNTATGPSAVGNGHTPTVSRALSSLEARAGPVAAGDNGDANSSPKWDIIPQVQHLFDRMHSEDQDTFRACQPLHQHQGSLIDLLNWTRDHPKLMLPKEMLNALCYSKPGDNSKKRWFCGMKECKKKSGDTLEHLRSHLQSKTHLDKTFYHCKICLHGFHYQHDLNIHKRNKHKGDGSMDPKSQVTDDGRPLLSRAGSQTIDINPSLVVAEAMHQSQQCAENLYIHITRVSTHLVRQYHRLLLSLMRIHLLHLV